MKHFTIVLALVAILMMTRVACALPGPTPKWSAIAEYDYATGQIVVSYNSLNYWYIESASNSLTGDAPMGLPAAGGLVTDNDTIIGESWIVPATATNLNLGYVAEASLPLGDLRLGWGVLGDPFGIDPVIYINVPEPASIALTLAATLCLVFRRLR